jgi:stage II sporulation SpoE-like protein/GAF domain-containing protein
MAGRIERAEDGVDGAESRYLLFLVRAGEILGLSLDYHETLRNVCAAAVETVADICFLDLGRGDNIDLVAAAHRVPGMSNRLVGAGQFLQECDGHPRHPVCSVIESGTSILVSDIDEAVLPRFATSPEHAQFMRDLGYRSMIVVPVVSHVQGILGALTLVRAYPSEERYDARALFFAEDLGRRCGVAISKSKLYSQSVEVASRLQLASLPRTLPAKDGIALDAYYEPAEAELLIGGDWYDAFNLQNGCVGISIGDVTGHGVDAAAFMRSIRDALRTALYGQTDLLRALQIADYLISEEFPEGRYATAQLAIYDTEKRTLTSASAGHPGPLVWVPSRGEVIDPFVSRGLALGMRTMDTMAPDTTCVVLEPDAMAVFFTDGLVEWNRDYVEGEISLRRAIANEDIRRAVHPARALRRAVVQGMHQDDIALLTLSVEG